MTSIRRRSHSASSSLDVSSSLSTKRAYPNHLTPESSPQKLGEPWRQGKRRRRELSPHPKDSTRNLVSPKPSLATTSAEFHLFPNYERNIDRRHSTCNFSSSFDFTSPFPTGETASQRLQSEAFIALSKSITESGEGFVRRMRDYEVSRSRAEAFSKVKDAQKRGRKRASLNVLKSSVHSDESDEDEDVQIVADDVPEVFSPRQKRAHSLEIIDSDNRHGSEKSCSDDEVPPSSAMSASSSSFTPALSRATSESTNSSLISLPLHASMPSVASRKSPQPSYILNLSASRSEKALAALSLAMANGAGSINDFSNLLSQHTAVLDDCQVGDMWH